MVSPTTSNLHPVNLEANRTFCPLFPIANDSWSSGTTTSILRLSSSTMTLVISAGAKALHINFAASGSQVTISIFSPRSSCTTACTLLPFIPTHAPTGSTSKSLELTAILALAPGSRATCTTCTIPSEISGTSFSNRTAKKFGWVLESIICGPRLNCFTSKIYALTRSPCLYDSLGICSFCGSSASALPTLTIMAPLSNRCTIPLRTSPRRSLKSS